jgi:hypothetical protein
MKAINIFKLVLKPSPKLDILFFLFTLILMLQILFLLYNLKYETYQATGQEGYRFKSEHSWSQKSCQKTRGSPATLSQCCQLIIR